MPSRTPSTPAPTAKKKAPSEALPTIGYAILTSLAHEPHSGYELSQLMGPPRNFMWEAKHSQVYPTLTLLADKGYVVYADVAQASKPDKKVYHITSAGRAALRAWARTGPTHVPVRDEFSLKLSAMCTLPPDEALALLDHQIDLVLAEIAAIDAHLLDFDQRFALPQPLPADHREFGLRSAIELSRELKSTAVACYRRLRAQLATGAAEVPGAKRRRTSTS